jgi:hypothetical protein
MVFPHDLNRYEPPLTYLHARADGLAQLLEQGVGPSFVRKEMRELLREIAEYTRTRYSFSSLDKKVRLARGIDIEALSAAARLLADAPKQVDEYCPDPAKSLERLTQILDVIRTNQHKWPLIEIALRLELGVEANFLDTAMCISSDWDPTPLVNLVKLKVERLSAERRQDLWSQVVAQFRPADDEDLADFRLVDHGVLPQGFLDAGPEEITQRLAEFMAWWRSCVIRRMLAQGRKKYPLPSVGMAKLLASTFDTDGPTPTELSIVRCLSNIAGLFKLRPGSLTNDDLAALFSLPADSALLAGEEASEFVKEAWTNPDIGPERAALHSMKMLVSSVTVDYQNETPMGIALFQYKAGLELFAPAIAKRMPRKELQLQLELCKFLLERGIVSVGTKFGQHETDLVARVRGDYVVVECKVLRAVPKNIETLQKNLLQLLRYDALNPAFMGRRAILVVYNFTNVPILTDDNLALDRAWIIAINAAAGPPSETKQAIRVVIEPEGGRPKLVMIGGDKIAPSAKGKPKRKTMT